MLGREPRSRGGGQRRHAVRARARTVGRGLCGASGPLRKARIVEFGSGLRPAFPDNLPRIAIDNQKIAVNGLYRHGFLLGARRSPSLRSAMCSAV